MTADRGELREGGGTQVGGAPRDGLDGGRDCEDRDHGDRDHGDRDHGGRAGGDRDRRDRDRRGRGLPPPEIIGVTPFGLPAPHLVVAVARAGGLGVLDLGTDREPALAALADVGRWWRGGFGVRVPAGCGVRPEELPDAVDTVLIDAADAADLRAPASPPAASDGEGTFAGEAALVDAVAYARGRRLLIEVVGPDEAAAAVRPGGRLRAAGRGPHGLIARGCEAGGRVGDLTTFVLLQHLLGDPRVDVPVHAAGGIGVHTAAAAVAGGAAGVVLDVQLALVKEMDLPADLVAVLETMDGSETGIVAGRRVHTRPAPADLADRPDVPGPRSAGATGSRARSRALPVGQDGALAAPLARRHGTAGGVVQAVRAQIDAHIRAAVRAEPLAPRDDPQGPRAAQGATGTPAVRGYPVVQGPMTRVSDRSAFAAAVAQDGGLPFLATALMSGEEVRELLLDTADRLGDLPWGVGVLGFAPPELREAQLAAVCEVRPPYALIAGGRPAQAAPLEEAGISTYLHVPSPGLLDRFLAEGARRFVFEGQECGGHVGPRAAFPLWEAQVERLLAFGDAHPERLGEMSVLFAGGIHDERSAAMVAALAGPLSERGADVRVLMGTAYLFTQEAVAAGAIQPGFQRAAVECEGTALLETSPGHATRCARTPYVQAFEGARRDMDRAGTPRAEMWRRLEELNLGRLRIASKGLRRVPATTVPVAAVPSDAVPSDRVPPATGRAASAAPAGAAVPVEPDEQRAEGLYMIGQVAALRSSTTSVIGLHEQVSVGATRFLADRAEALGLTGAGEAARYGAGERANPADVAIVGIGCVLPGARDADAYWANIVGGVDAVTEVPAGRWDTGVYYDPAGERELAGERTPSKWGGFLPDIPFDAIAYGIPPGSLSSVEPVQLLALEVAARALADAGYADRPFDRSRTSVYFGAEAGTDLGAAYSARAVLPGYYGEVPAGLDEQLPRLTADSFTGVLTNMIAGRIANRLDLGGANYTVDAACAASLAALDSACKELVAGGSDMVLCGGADLHNGIYDYLMFSSVHALSPNGRCAAFDDAADGIALGEGVACVALKRLADAERDGDRIYAVVKSVAGSSDGRSAGLTAPRAEGQRRALDRAYARAGVSPADVGLVEAHGTGTEVGDRTELATLTGAFAAAGAAPGGAALGSVKSQIGHTKCAAGLAGLIKTAYALHAGVLPGTLHLERPNPVWDARTSPFAFGRAARPWASEPAARFAGISGFGFGGANFHAVLSGYGGAPEPVSGLAEWPVELFLIRGADRAAVRAELDRLGALLATGRRLRDLARTFAAGDGPVRIALVATGPQDLEGKLAAAREFRPEPGVHVAPAEAADPGRVAFLYPGQGSQRPNMLADLFVAFPRLQRLLRLAGGRHAAAMFPPVAFTPEDAERQRAALTDTRAAQPALGIAGLAVHRLLTALGVRPDLAAGHSYGELVALCAAGAFGEEDLIALSTARAEAILAAAEEGGGDPGAMAAVSATPAEVRAALAGVPEIVVANHNAPRQVVVSGSSQAVERALAVLGGCGVAAERLPVACAFHSPIVAGAAAGLRAELAGRDLRSPAYPVWSNTTAAPYDADPAQLGATLAGQVAAPVRFVDQIEAMYAAGARVFVEAGPGRVLTGLVGRILGDRPHTAVNCDAPGEGGLERFLAALAELAVAGVPVDPLPLFAGRDARVVSAADPRPAPGWIVNGHLVRTADGKPLANSLRPAERVAPPAAGGRPHDAGPGTSEAAVLEYLRSSRELIAAQRDVVLGYLGASGQDGDAPPVPAPRPAAARDETADGAPAGPTPPLPESTPPPTDAKAIGAAVRAEIAARTGYPEHMLGEDLDLEADLSVDSIKRTEIIGALAERVGLAPAGTRLDESIAERLARIRTIGGIAACLCGHLGLDAAPDAPAVPGPAPAPAPAPVPAAGAPRPGVPAQARPADPVPPVPPAGSAPQRQVVRTAELPALAVPEPPAGPFAGKRFVIVDDGRGIALELADLLERHGARVRTPMEAGAADPAAGRADCDGLIHLAALRPGGGPVLPGAYGGIRDALLGGARWLVVGTGGGGTFGRGREDGAGAGPGEQAAGAGLRGLARTLAAEFPEVLVRALDVDAKDDPRAVAARVLAELAATGPPVVVGYEGDARRTLTVVPAELPGAAEPASPVPDGGVVLLTGGARGITARVARRLARSSGCHIEVVGRTPEPAGPEDPALAGAPDEVALRRALVARGGLAPAEIEAVIWRILAAREVHRNLDALRGDAATVRYHAADVRDPRAVRAVVEDVYARHGRLDGVVHGAGLLEDRLVRDKDPGSFDRVYRTKVDGACALAAAVRPDVGFFVVFGSVAGVYGNPGQADYAAANDACATLARTWRDRLHGRVLVADWGPWAGGGMVSPALARRYARRGIALLDPDAAVAALFRELAEQRGDETQVVFTGTPR